MLSNAINETSYNLLLFNPNRFLLKFQSIINIKLIEDSQIFETYRLWPQTAGSDTIIAANIDFALQARDLYFWRYDKRNSISEAKRCVLFNEAVSNGVHKSKPGVTVSWNSCMVPIIDFEGRFVLNTNEAIPNYRN